MCSLSPLCAGRGLGAGHDANCSGIIVFDPKNSCLLSCLAPHPESPLRAASDLSPQKSGER
jgi:hypothetical protein